MFIIQKLVTTWTKSSRGGAGAQLRAAVPANFPLPAAHSAPVLVQEITFSELVSFAPRETRCDAVEAVPGADLGVEFENLADNLEVRAVWHVNCGAPERELGRVTRLFMLTPNEWARFVFNGRLATGDEWSYQQVAYNVANLNGYSRSVFSATLPKIVCDERAPLW